MKVCNNPKCKAIKSENKELSKLLGRRPYVPLHQYQKLERKLKGRDVLQFRLYSITENAVANGVSYGWHRAHKYQDKPDETTFKEEMIKAVMSSLEEVIRFEESL